MRKIENKIMLITYADSLGGNLKEMDRMLDTYFPNLFGGVHILPFFPSSGDRGFAVVNYDIVDPAFGTWEDIDRLGEKYYLMADFMLNHVSIRCDEFKDYMEKGDASAYKDMFVHWEKFWPDGEPTEADLETLYRRKANGPYMSFDRADGKTVRLWNTFFQEQIDIDPHAEATKEYYCRNLGRIASHVPLIRFDAFAYASKVPGTSCFFVEPEIWDVLEIGMEPLRATGTEMLPEIHENYTIQLKMAEKGYWVYDFALPGLLLHSLFTGDTKALHHWLNICPRKQFTTLDTHDGIGMVDIVGLLSEEEIDALTQRVDTLTADAKQHIKLPSLIRIPGKPVQRYQLMSSYYSATGCDDRGYLLARTLQLFAPGIPQVYYVGMLAGKNDIQALIDGGEPRSVNRHNYTEEEIADAMKNPLVQDMHRIMAFRNTCPAFDGEVSIDPDCVEGKIAIRWTNCNTAAVFTADFTEKSFMITEISGNNETVIFSQN